jgi:putative CocE/NonD family hydrolase
MQKYKNFTYLPIVLGLSLVTASCNDHSNEPAPITVEPLPIPNIELIRSDAYPGIICEVLSIPMRDGILTTGFVYRLDEELSQQYPVIINRTPYARIKLGRGCFVEDDTTLADGTIYARSGYAYVVQSTRGTYTSGGMFDIFRQEKNDGYDSVEWAAAQPWSNGLVGIRGASYMGMTTWQATISAPPSLKAASISVSSEDNHREWVYDQGIPHHSMNISWPELTFTSDQIIRRETKNGRDQEVIDQMIVDRQKLSAKNMWNSWVWQLPLTSFNQFDELHRSYQTWLEHPLYDDFWRAMDVGENIEKVTFPVLIHGAWYDIFANGSFASFESMRNRSGSVESRGGTKLMISQYGHATNHSTPSFGADAFGFHADLVNMSTQGKAYQPYDIDYFDYYLKGNENGYNDKATATLAIMVPPDIGEEGSHFIIETQEYPLADTEFQLFYLRSHGDANNRTGSGKLSISADLRDAGILEYSVVEEPSFSADLFSYDPLKPVPTMGGNLCCATDSTGGPSSGAVEQAEIEIRDDVLVYTSEPLTESLTIIGPVKVELFAKSSATDTDFMAKLVDVRPDNSTHNILDGAVRARLRDGSKSKPSLIVANKTYKYTINLGHTGVVFPVGHKIRLQISSSSFPKFARNLNTGASNEATSETMIAKQVILHDAINASRLILPVVDGVVSIP